MKIFLKELLKILIFLIFLEGLILSNFNSTKAAGFFDDVISYGNDFEKEGKEEAMKDDAASDEETAEIMTILYNVLLTIGIIVSIGVGGVLGIKFMMASAEDKAKVKESMIPYVAGCIVIFGAFMIWKLVIGILSKL